MRVHTCVHARARVCVRACAPARQRQHRCKLVSHLLPGAILHKWPYCTSGHIAHVAILHTWPYCAEGHIAQVAILHRWPYCTDSHIAQADTSHRWPVVLRRQPHCTGDHIAHIAASRPFASLHTRNMHICVHVHVHTCATDMPTGSSASTLRLIGWISIHYACLRASVHAGVRVLHTVSPFSSIFNSSPASCAVPNRHYSAHHNYGHTRPARPGPARPGPARPGSAHLSRPMARVCACVRACVRVSRQASHQLHGCMPVWRTSRGSGSGCWIGTTHRLLVPSILF